IDELLDEDFHRLRTFPCGSPFFFASTLAPLQRTSLVKKRRSIRLTPSLSRGLGPYNRPSTHLCQKDAFENRGGRARNSRKVKNSCAHETCAPAFHICVRSSVNL